MAIIAITQYPGTRAFELGRLLSDRLGYRFLTADDLISTASRIYGVTPEQAVIADERRPHFWERLKTDTQRFVPLFRAVALKEMARGRVILYGRSVGHLMPDYGQCLRVRLAGPIKLRVIEVMREENLSAAAAERRVRDYDREVRARVQTLFDVDLEDPAVHHLTINTFATPLPVVTDLLALAAEELDRQATPEQRGLLQDTALAAQVRAALMIHPKIGQAPVEVVCERGFVHVTGPGLVPPWDRLVGDVARTIDGVSFVEVNPEEIAAPVRPA
ncbi:MAG TPA: cytidylate kinase family protein [Candidatus Binataceae bacterium]|nr:cytidylate kinase family protein [Candidatus Binataceae bacterium]